MELRWSRLMAREWTLVLLLSRRVPVRPILERRKERQLRVELEPFGSLREMLWLLLVLLT
jgi:hypothetical protein